MTDTSGLQKIILGAIVLLELGVLALFARFMKYLRTRQK